LELRFLLFKLFNNQKDFDVSKIKPL